MSVAVANESGIAVDEPGLAGVGRFVLAEMGINPLAELSVLVVDAEHMSALHEHWMDEPGPTDVLAFPMDELAPPRPRRPEPGAGAARRRRALPRGRRPAGRDRRALDGRRAAAADHPRHPAPARLRPRRARGGEARCSALQDKLLAGWRYVRTGAGVTAAVSARVRTRSSCSSSPRRWCRSPASSPPPMPRCTGSPRRALAELAPRGRAARRRPRRAGCRRPPGSLNLLLLLRVACEMLATVLVAVVLAAVCGLTWVASWWPRRR